MSIYRRNEIWWVRFRHQGQHIRRSARTRSRRVAEEYERQLREEYSRLARGGKERRTFNEVMARFVNEHLPNLRPESARRYVTSIHALKPYFDGLYVDEITRGRISEFIAARRRIVSTTSVRRDLACLSSALELAIIWEWADQNPVKAINKRHLKLLEAPPRTRYLTHTEYDRLLRHAQPYLRPLIVFAVATGLRLEEQLSLRWQNVDFPERKVFVPRTKTGTPREVPLTEEVVSVLRTLPHHINSPYVFCKRDGSRYGKLTRGLSGAANRAGVENLRWHDLRRTCGSWLLQGGMDMKKVSQWLGHKSIAVTERSYAFLRTEDLLGSAQKRSQVMGIADQ